MTNKHTLKEYIAWKYYEMYDKPISDIKLQKSLYFLKICYPYIDLYFGDFTPLTRTKIESKPIDKKAYSFKKCPINKNIQTNEYIDKILEIIFKFKENTNRGECKYVSYIT